MYHSYVMGIDESIYTLENQGFEINRDGGNFMVSFQKENEYDYKITLKCTEDTGQFYRMAYPEKVVRGYHCPPVQQPYWNTVFLNDFPDEELLNMIDLAYDTVFSKFSKKEQIRMLEEL